MGLLPRRNCTRLYYRWNIHNSCIVSVEHLGDANELSRPHYRNRVNFDWILDDAWQALILKAFSPRAPVDPPSDSGSREQRSGYSHAPESVKVLPCRKDWSGDTKMQNYDGECGDAP